MAITRDQLASARAEITTVEIDGLGEVNLSPVSHGEFMRYSRAIQAASEDADDRGEQLSDAMIWLVARTLVDDDGQRFFGPAEREAGVEMLNERPVSTVTDLRDEVLALYGMGGKDQQGPKEAMQEEVGNSDGTTDATEPTA